MTTLPQTNNTPGIRLIKMLALLAFVVLATFWILYSYSQSKSIPVVEPLTISEATPVSVEPAVTYQAGLVAARAAFDADHNATGYFIRLDGRWWVVQADGDKFNLLNTIYTNAEETKTMTSEMVCTEVPTSGTVRDVCKDAE